LPFLPLLAAALLLAYQLFVPPVTGIADNGDFEKVLGYVGLRHAAESRGDKYYQWVNRDFRFAPFGWYQSGHLGTETAIALATRTVAGLAGGETFDLRWQGAAHLLLLLAGLALCVAATAPLPPAIRLTVAVFLCFVFSDAGYAAPLNSFYGQAASLAFLLLAVGGAAAWMRHRERPGPWPLLFLAAGTGFVFSKPQEALQAGFVALAFLSLNRASGWLRPRAAVPLALVPVLVGAAVMVKAPVNVRLESPFHMVFSEIVPHSPDAAADLRWFGLEPQLARYARVSAYDRGSPIGRPAFQREFSARVSSLRILQFYLAHPARLLELATRRAEQAFTLQPPHIGTFEKASGQPARALTSRFTHWSTLKRLLIPEHLLTIVLLFGGSLALCAWQWRTSPRPECWECLALLSLMPLVAFGICIVGDCYENERHLFTFNAMTDLVLVADATFAASLLATRRQAAGSALLDQPSKR